MTGDSPLDERRERRVYPAAGGLSRILECGSLLPLCAGQGKPCPEEGGGQPTPCKAATRRVNWEGIIPQRSLLRWGAH